MSQLGWRQSLFPLPERDITWFPSAYFLHFRLGSSCKMVRIFPFCIFMTMLSFPSGSNENGYRTMTTMIFSRRGNVRLKQRTIEEDGFTGLRWMIGTPLPSNQLTKVYRFFFAIPWLSLSTTMVIVLHRGGWRRNIVTAYDIQRMDLDWTVSG